MTVVSTVPTLAGDVAPGNPRCGPAADLRRRSESTPSSPRALWAPGRELWNTYGPTEATVVACAAMLHPGEPVRIGLPLAGWDLAVVDADGAGGPRGWNR